jgi:hypothetical protein
MEDGNGIAIFINSENSDIIKELMNSVIEEYNWKGFEKKKQKIIISVSEPTLQKYLGDYEAVLPDRNVISGSIKRKNGSYWWISNGVDRKMYFTSEKEFFNMEVPTEKSFFADANGAILGFTSRFGNNVVEFKKVK